MFKVVLLVALGGIGAVAASDVSGKWIATTKTQSGAFVDIYLTVHRQGQDVSGTISHEGETKQAPIEKAEVQGDQLSFEARESADRVVAFRLTVADDSLTGQMTNGELVSKVTFRPQPPAGVYRAHGGVSPPTLAHKVNPSYSKEARKKKIEGTVLLYVQVDQTGNAIHIRVLHSLGFGLDEKAIEAVKKWKFRPGVKDGRPVIVEAQIEVNFRLV